MALICLFCWPLRPAAPDGGLIEGVKHSAYPNLYPKGFVLAVLIECCYKNELLVKSSDFGFHKRYKPQT